MGRTKGAKNKPKGIKAPEANGLNGKAPLTEDEIKAIAAKVESEVCMDAYPIKENKEGQ